MIMNEYLNASGRVLWASSQGKGSLCWHVHVSKSRMTGARCARAIQLRCADTAQDRLRMWKWVWDVGGQVQIREGGLMWYWLGTNTSRSPRECQLGWGAERLDSTAAGAPVYFATRSCADLISLLGAKTGMDGKG